MLFWGLRTPQKVPFRDFAVERRIPPGLFLGIETASESDEAVGRRVNGLTAAEPRICDVVVLQVHQLLVFGGYRSC